ncbi:MAG: aminotransferase class IV [Candidatus Zipacnadales bacterium]
MLALVRVNGVTTGLTEGAVSALDHGLLYGNGLFETMRATNGRILGLADHLKRLRQGGVIIDLPVPPSETLAEEIAAALCEAQEADAYVRLTVTRGPGAPAPDPSTCEAPTVMVVVKPFIPPEPRWMTTGLHTLISSIRRNTFSPLSRVKSLNYMECILAKQEAKRAGADEAIFLDTDGNLAEATAWNLFLVNGRTLKTPSTRGPILPGITRQIVIRLARQRGLEVEEGTYAPSCLQQAEEAFLTNSLYGVVPVGTVDGTPIGQTIPGPKTSMVGYAYEALRQAECGA